MSADPNREGKKGGRTLFCEKWAWPLLCSVRKPRRLDLGRA